MYTLHFLQMTEIIISKLTESGTQFARTGRQVNEGTV